MIEAVTVRADGAGVRDRVVVLGLGTAVAYGALAQGGYYGKHAVTLLVLVALAAVARATVPARPLPRGVTVAAVCWVSFAAWALVSGTRAGDLPAALPTAAGAAALAAVAVAAAGLVADARKVLVTVVLAAAVVVAVSAWAGVALHLEPLALPSSGLWRGASTITYANASAAFLVTALLLVIAMRPVRHRLIADGLAAVLLLGLATTMSRAGALGLAVAATVLLARTGRPSTEQLHRAGAVLVAVAVAFTGLLPALPAEAPAQPLPAALGLLAGASVLVIARRPAHLAAIAVAGALLPAVLPSAAAPLQAIAETRLDAGSAERADLAGVTAERLWSTPLTGVGPGRLDLRYVDHTGERVRAVYTHDEYLQTAAETGLVGLTLAVAGLVALAVTALRARSREGAAAAAILAAFAVHSALDFLWHVPVLPLLVVLTVVALTTPAHPDGRRTHEDDAEDRDPGRAGPGAQRRAGGVGRGGERTFAADPAGG